MMFKLLKVKVSWFFKRFSSYSTNPLKVYSTFEACLSYKECLIDEVGDILQINSIKKPKVLINLSKLAVP